MTTIDDVRAACQLLHETFCPATCLSAFPIISVTEAGADVVLSARRWAQSYPSPAAAMRDLPRWGTRFRKTEGEIRKALMDGGFEI